MPRNNREYLLRYADQSINDLERALDRMKMLSDAYGGVYTPMEGEVFKADEVEVTEYSGLHAKYQQYVDVNASLLTTILENMQLFRKQYM